MDTAKRTFRVAAHSFKSVPGDVEGNSDIIRAGLAQMDETGAQIYVTPELVLAGYDLRKDHDDPSITDLCEDGIEALAPATKGKVAFIGTHIYFQQPDSPHPEYKNVEGKAFNGVAIIVDGEVRAIRLKSRLASHTDGRNINGPYEEELYFHKGEWATEIEFCGKKIPVLGKDDPFVITEDMVQSDSLKNLVGLRILVEICEEHWRKDRPANAHTAGSGKEVDLVVGLHGSFEYFAWNGSDADVNAVKGDHRDANTLEGTQITRAPTVGAYAAGNQGGAFVLCGGAKCTMSGDTEAFMLKEAPRLAFNDDNILTTPAFDLDEIRRRQETGEGFRREEFPADELKEPLAMGWEHMPHHKYEIMARILTKGLLDYMVATKRQGIALSFSGGMDSTSCALFVRLMSHYAFAELGVEGVQKKFAYLRNISYEDKDGNTVRFPKINEIDTPEKLMERLLLTFYQKTKNNSEAGEMAAQTLTEAYGSRHYTLEIDAAVDALHASLEKGMNRSLGWEAHHALKEGDPIRTQNMRILYENAAARWRGINILQAGNIDSLLVLAPSDWNEIWRKYYTLGGDDNGHLGLLAGVCKEAPFDEGLVGFMMHVAKGELWGYKPTAKETEAYKMVLAQDFSPELMPKEFQQKAEAEGRIPYIIDSCIAYHQHVKQGKTPLETFIGFERFYAPELVKYWDQMDADYARLDVRTFNDATGKFDGPLKKSNRMPSFDLEQIATVVDKTFSVHPGGQFARYQLPLSIFLGYNLDAENTHRLNALNKGFGKQIEQMKAYVRARRIVEYAGADTARREQMDAEGIGHAKNEEVDLKLLEKHAAKRKFTILKPEYFSQEDQSTIQRYFADLKQKAHASTKNWMTTLMQNIIVWQR